VATKKGDWEEAEVLLPLSASGGAEAPLWNALKKESRKVHDQKEPRRSFTKPKSSYQSSSQNRSWRKGHSSKSSGSQDEGKGGSQKGKGNDVRKQKSGASSAGNKSGQAGGSGAPKS
jgi:hypothetical protein